MGEWCKLLKDIKYNKENFAKLLEYMNPLINKYVRLLYKDESEDMRAELMLALWESILKMNYYNNDGECVTYINNALRNKFLELYRKSKKLHDYQSTVELEEIPENTDSKILNTEFSDVIFREDINRLLGHVNERKKQLSFQILLEDKSDAEIAKNFNISRQYVNRERKKLYTKLKKSYYEENQDEA